MNTSRARVGGSSLLVAASLVTMCALDGVHPGGRIAAQTERTGFRFQVTSIDGQSGSQASSFIPTGQSGVIFEPRSATRATCPDTLELEARATSARGPVLKVHMRFVGRERAQAGSCEVSACGCGTVDVELVGGTFTPGGPASITLERTDYRAGETVRGDLSIAGRISGSPVTIRGSFALRGRARAASPSRRTIAGTPNANRTP